MKPLEGKVAIVTGGSGYIGGGIVDVLAEQGAKLALLDINPESLAKKCAELAAAGVESAPFTVDLVDYESVKNTIDAVIKHFGKIDILVNCAGMSARHDCRPFEIQKIEIIHRIIDMNLYGTLHCLHAVVPHMVAAKSGKIINIGSLVGSGCVRGCIDYGAAKAGIISATRTLALELGQYNITVNCVSPGKVPRPDENPANERAFAHQYTLLNRQCTARDIGSLVGFLCGPDANYITGEDYKVAGGRDIGLRGDQCWSCWKDVQD